MTVGRGLECGLETAVCQLNALPDPPEWGWPCSRGSQVKHRPLGSCGWGLMGPFLMRKDRRNQLLGSESSLLQQIPSCGLWQPVADVMEIHTTQHSSGSSLEKYPEASEPASDNKISMGGFPNHHAVWHPSIIYSVYPVSHAHLPSLEIPELASPSWVALGSSSTGILLQLESHFKYQFLRSCIWPLQQSLTKWPYSMFFTELFTIWNDLVYLIYIVYFPFKMVCLVRVNVFVSINLAFALSRYQAIMRNQ